MNIVKTACLIFALFSIGWFISFQYDPYKVCRDHSDPSMKKDYYECEPGGFALKKGSRLERSEAERFPWERHGDVIIPTERAQKRQRKEEQKAVNNGDNYECDQEFYLLPSDKLTEVDFAKYCRTKGQRKSREVESQENFIPNSATEEL